MGAFPPLALSKISTVMESVFSGSAHIYSFGDAKETLKSVEKQLECENGRDLNRVAQKGKQKAVLKLLLLLTELEVHLRFCHRPV